jgi:hypothetical protein
MKRSRLVIALSPTLLALALACSAGKQNANAKRDVATYDPNSDDGDGGSGNAPLHDVPDASALTMDAAFNPLKRIDTPAQALQVLITSYDDQITEGQIGLDNGNTPPMKAFAGDVVQEGKNGKARIRQVAANAHITPASSMMNDQLKFESAASVMNLQNGFRNMFADSWCRRISDSAGALVRSIDQDIMPIITDDTLKAAVQQTRDEADKRQQRANAVRSGLNDPGNANGMFPEQEDPAPQPQPQGNNQAAGDGGAAP